jgi:hypothetical protein
MVNFHLYCVVDVLWTPPECRSDQRTASDATRPSDPPLSLEHARTPWQDTAVRLNQRVLDWCCSSLSFQPVSANAIIIIPITRSALDTLDHRARLCGILQVMRAGVLITRTRIEMFAPNHVADFACVYTLDSRSLG